MQTTSHKPKNAVVQLAVSQELIDWIKSEAGKAAVDSAIKDSQRAVNHLSESRKIQPEQLYVPITL